MEFSLKNQEYIELNKLLQILNWVASGGEAKNVINEELVLVNDKVELRKRCKLRLGDKVIFQEMKCLITA